MKNSKPRAGVIVLGGLLIAVGFHLSSTDRSEEDIKLSLNWAAAESPEREQLESTKLIMEALELEPGLRVADVGAGGGFFTFLMASHVGPSGAVLATDTDELMVSLMKAHKRKKNVTNVKIKLTEHEGSFDLGVNAVDRILLSNVFPFSSCDKGRGERLLSEALVALRPGGRLVIWQDWVHLTGWRGGYGPPRECDDLDADAIIARAGSRYSVDLKRKVDKGSTDPLELPGYFLVLEPAVVANVR